MSYIQIEIGGKLRGLKFNQLAIVILSQKADPERYSETANYAMVFAGLTANCYVKQDPADFTFEEVCDWVDLLSQETIDAIDKALGEAQAYRKWIDATKKNVASSKKKLKNTTVKV